MIRWWGKFFPSHREQTFLFPTSQNVPTTAHQGEKFFTPTTSTTPAFQPKFQTPTRFADLSQQRIFTLTVSMFGNPAPAAIQHFFQDQVPQIVALLRSKPTLMKNLATTCEKMPAPFGAFTGIACGANALPEALSGLKEISAEEEGVTLQALRRIYPFNPQASGKLIETLGTQGTLENRLRVLELVLTSQAGNRDSINALLAGISENASPTELNQTVFPRLLALIHKAAPADRNLAFKQGWLANCLKGWLGEELENGRLSNLNAVAYRQRFDPKNQA